MKKKVKTHAPGNLRQHRSNSRPECVQMQKSQPQAQSQRNRRVPDHLPQADAGIAQAQAQIEAGALQLPDRHEAVDPAIQQQNLVEDGQMRRPRGLKPAQIDSQAQHGENQKIAPVAALFAIGPPGLPKQARNRDRKEGVQRKPTPAEHPRRTRNQHIGHGQGGGRCKPYPHRKGLRPAGEATGKESRCHKRRKRKQGRDRICRSHIRHRPILHPRCRSMPAKIDPGRVQRFAPDQTLVTCFGEITGNLRPRTADTSTSDKWRLMWPF